MGNEALPTIAITIGDPAGIGPEVVLKALTDQELLNTARWVAIGDAAILKDGSWTDRFDTTELHRSSRAICAVVWFENGTNMLDRSTPT